jgi:hypothetical protein
MVLNQDMIKASEEYRQAFDELAMEIAGALGQLQDIDTKAKETVKCDPMYR